jgi:hypothetical protein
MCFHVSSMSFQLFVILCVFNVPLLCGFCANTLIIKNYYYYYYYYYYVQSAYENIVVELEGKSRSIILK